MTACTRLFIFVLAAALPASRPAAGAPATPPSPPDRAQLDFFESRVRPLLIQHCYKCHSTQAEKLKGGLMLDSAESILKGGDSGPALVPGNPDKSLLIEAVRYEDEDTAMPPKGKLPDAAVADLATWVKMGAPWPKDAARPGKSPAAAETKPDYEKLRREHWAYQPIRKADPPAVKDEAWPLDPIDHFILAKLEAKGLEPAPQADKRTLVRRLYFDLAGLPPTPEQVDGFVSDTSPDAYEKLVDRLLASPHFGERWGRHWLDVARFAESLTLRGFVLKDAWRYRDYVIHSFNQDRPFDRFMQEQVGGDLMPADSVEERRRRMTATTFLAIGNTNLEEQDKKQLVMDVVDEQLETIGKAFLAQTIGCARCHDHKFDPIPTADYYALAGILKNAKTLEHANVSKWMEVPLPEDPARESELKEHEAAVAALQAQIKDAKAALAKARTKDADKPPKTGKPTVVALKDLPGVVVDDAEAKKVGEWKASTSVATYIGGGYLHDNNTGKGEKTLTFQPELPRAGKYEVRLAYTPGASRATAVPVTVFSADGDKTIEVNQQEPPPVDGRFVSLGQYNFEKNGAGFVLVSNEGTTGHVIADAVQFLAVEEVLALAPTSDAPRAASVASAARALPEDVKRMEDGLKKLIDSGPKRTTIVSVVEEENPDDTCVHIRGVVHNLGPKVPRGFLSAVPVADPPAISTNESGRRQLGEWLARSDNPLPARVMANRAWHWLTGDGLVRTVDNFGTTGEPPSHPELLDHLASRFVEDGWSVKKLVRRIVLSRTYRLSVATDPKGLAADPENRLRWRANRRRLEAECIRDAMLSVSGQLDTTMGGPTFKPNVTADYGYRHTDTRRSVYSPVFRNALPEVFEAFDFADPSMPTGRRYVSTVAPQALFQ
jgi:cytochrome c553